RALVRVLWRHRPHVSRRWDTKIASSVWMLKDHPDVAAHRFGASRLMGQIAFAHASSSNRSEAWRWAMRSVRGNPFQWRGWNSMGGAFAPQTREGVLGKPHRWGRGGVMAGWPSSRHQVGTLMKPLR